jgi:hypothetical protein
MRLRPRLAAGFVLLALSASFTATAFAQYADSPEGEIVRNAKIVKQLTATRAKRLGVSAGPDPDTVYVGKSYTNHTAPDNYWNIYIGSYLPGLNVGTNAMWDWDNTVGIQAPDSLMGWWPIRRQYNSTGGLTLTDDQRPWWALDHGNLGNYVLSQQSSAKRTFGVVSYWHADPGQQRRFGDDVVADQRHAFGVVRAPAARGRECRGRRHREPVQPGLRPVPARCHQRGRRLAAALPRATSTRRTRCSIATSR